MEPNSYKRNHYVPEWYQKRFLPHDGGPNKYFYLDLKPNVINYALGISKKKRDLEHWGTRKSFFEDDLYTTRFGKLESTEIERYFFGKFDRIGKTAVEEISHFEHTNFNPRNIQNLISYMSIQKLRTPKGLLGLEHEISQPDKNKLLFAMQKLRQMYCATWAECVWSIASAANSPTKFIISDHPITVYNNRCPPSTAMCIGALEPDIRLNGTHTLFPISPDKIIILTNLSWVRNPLGDALKMRPHSALFRPTLINILDIQVGRELSETEVREINFVIKRRAFRYIAAAKKEWLYPEVHLSQTGWSSLGAGDLLMPDPRSMSFHAESIVGYESGAVEGFDAYGRQNWSDPALKVIAKREMNSFLGAQGLTAKKHGPRRRGRTYSMGGLGPEFDSEEMHRIYLSYYKFNKKFKRSKKK